jgi:exopolysaccharide production protein ExoZ
MTVQSRGESFEGVQALRLIAAAMVLVLHSTFYVQSHGDPYVERWAPGFYGVHIFFVISGFVMAISVHRDWQDFAKSRVARIIPLYWFVIIVKLFVILAMPVLSATPIDIGHVLRSALLIPSTNGSGIVEPFYGVGWTLQYEDFFFTL